LLIDGKAQRRGPRCRVVAGLLQDPVAERHDQAGVFRDRNELVGADQSALRMTPAYQRLGPADALSPHVNDRLIVQLELAVRNRLAQIIFEGLLGVGGLDHLGLEQAEIIAPLGLRRIEREVCLLEQVSRVAAVLRANAIPMLVPMLTS
jgi:hypothetical protein